MSEGEDFRSAMDNAKWRYSTHGLDAFRKSYEYGVLVVKNAFLVAGGGLFFIPAMVGLSAQVEFAFAFRSGAFFAIAVLAALVGNYVIHINWLLHGIAWDRIFELEKISIREVFGRSFSDDKDEEEKIKAANAKTGKWIRRTFFLPHILAIIYLIFLVLGALNLYRAFGITFLGAIS